MIIQGVDINGNPRPFLVDHEGRIMLSGDSDMNGFLLTSKHSTVLSPADSTTYYIGNAQGAPGTVAQRARLRVFDKCILRGLALEINVAGVLGTAEASTFNVRVNDVTNTLIFNNVVMNAIQNAFVSGFLSLQFQAGYFFEGQLVTPAWVTNPTNVSFVVYYWFELN